MKNWLYQGRISIAAVPLGIARIGNIEDLTKEQNSVLALPDELRSFAPEELAWSASGGTAEREEAHHGPLALEVKPLLQSWLKARKWQPLPLSRQTLRQHLRSIKPHGRIDAAGLRERLREVGVSISRKAIERALQQSIEVCWQEGWVHGALIKRRIREKGFICWRSASPTGKRGEDIAPYLEFEEMPLDIQLHMLKWSWHNAPLRALALLEALHLLRPPLPPRVNLSYHAHPGLPSAQLAEILGAPQGEVSTHIARKSLWRAARLNIGGEPITCTTTPTIPHRKDPQFIIPRQRSNSDLFSRYEQGIQLDELGRYSLTPEHEALQLAAEARASRIIDAFCGCGGNSIAFARQPHIQEVIAFELDKNRFTMAQNNVSIYGVEEKIRLHNSSFFAEPVLDGLLFLDPPWSWGSNRLRELLHTYRKRYATGIAKLPRSFPFEQNEQFELLLSPEGFPRYALYKWGL